MVEHVPEECPYCRVDILREKSLFWKRRDLVIIATSGVLFVMGLLFEFLEVSEAGGLLLFVAATAIPGVFVVRRSIRSIRRGNLDVHVLMTVAAVGAFSIGYWAEGAAVLLLFYIAEFLEDYAGERAKRSVGELLELAPEVAIRKTKAGEEKVHSHEVEIGEVIVVRPGERIPLDGEIVKGSTSVNQAPVTGESVPVAKGEGDEVFGGTLNEEGYVEVKVTKLPSETTLSKIVKLVRNAQKQKSKTEELVSRFANYYTPTILVLAFLVAVVPTLLFLPGNWVYRSLVLLAVSCPCALVLSTPISMVSAITSAAKNGLLIKGGAYVEEITREGVLALDKTRTLTEGQPRVTDVIPLKGSENNVLQIAASLESRSKHPIARAILDHAREEGVELLETSEFEAVPGKGVMGFLDSEQYLLGTKSFFDEKGIEYSEEEVDALERQGRTVVLVGDRSQVLGMIGAKDRVRKNAAKMIEELRKNGIMTIMLTGDNERVAKAIAREIKVDKYYSGLLPEEKADIIRELVKKYDHVSMIGDGVNDAPALAEAHVGIAMGAAGSDIAIETADVVLMEDDLERVSYLRRLGDKTISTVRENITVSITVKGILAVLAVLGFVSLAAAVGIGDMGISFVVIMNALRLGLVK